MAAVSLNLFHTLREKSANCVDISTNHRQLTAWKSCYKHWLSCTQGRRQGLEPKLNNNNFVLRCCASDTSHNPQANGIEISRPRRSLLVSFNCDACGVRTQRMVNRAAYERGTVFVQCAGCEAYHKLVDNLGLIVEYDFRNDPDVS